MDPQNKQQSPQSQPVGESFANRFIKKNGYLYCPRCYTKLQPTDLPHDCRDGRAWAAR